MDPLSVAGLAIGVVGVTFQLFSGCVTAYQLLLDANGMPERYQYLWVRLQMEQHKLLDWARIANLSEDDATLSSGLRLSRHLINDALHQIEALLLDLSGLRTRYKLTLVAEGTKTPDSGKGHTRAAAAVAEASPGTGHEIKAKALDLIARSRRYPTRLRWAAFDADKFSSLLADLTALNDNMMYFLETDQKRVAFQLQQASFMRILQVSDKVDELIDLVSSLEVAGKGARVQGPPAVLGEETSADPASAARQTQEQRLVRLARFKALSVVVERGQSPDDPRAVSLGQSTTGNLEIDAAELGGLTSVDYSTSEITRSWYTYRGSDVWVEWKTYIGQGFDSLPPSYVEDRVRKLAALLHNDQKPSEFCVPDCLGYVHQPELERFGYVFRWPGTTPNTPTSPPTSLHTLLHDLPCLPPLGTRLAIMRAIATSIWYLHATNWLHKGLRSDNVLFHLSPSAPSPTAQTTPYLSGFEYARPSSASERTERPLARHLPHELYRHPRVQFDLPRESTIVLSNAAGQPTEKRRGFRKRHDIYALGVVLLEVALWEPVYKILGLKGEEEVTPRVARGAWEALAEVRGYEGRLRGMVGDGVAEAVVGCIIGRLVAGEDGGEDGADEVLLQAALGERVVGRLEGVVV